MANVIPFTPRGAADGGWSAAERARLAELAERLSAAEGVKVEAVYGVSDEGDPWCVIKDENEEVLVHVARIDGQFVIHDAAADAVQEGDSLWTACDRLLGEAWRDPREEVVVPLSHRQAQSVIALALAVAFIHEVQEAEASIDPDAVPPPMEAAAAITVAALVAPPPASADQPRQELLAPQALDAGKVGSAGGPDAAEPELLAASASEQAADAPTTEAAPVEMVQTAAPLAAPTEPAEAETAPVQVIQGTAGADTLQGGEGRDEIHGAAGDDSLSGGDGADILRGGLGADTLDGGEAGFGEVDVLDGGEGDDQLVLSGQVVATGGEGADTFVIAARPPPNSSGLLGVISDYRMEEGDRFTFQDGRTVKPVLEVAVENMPGVPGFGTESTTQGFNGRQVFVDFDNDGIADGHVLIANRVQPDGAVTPVIVEAQVAPSQAVSDADYGFRNLPDGYALLG